MSTKIDSLRIAGTRYDRRVKLTDEQRAEIRARYAEGDVSTYKLANEYGVSRRTIDFVLHSERYDRCREQRKERGKDGRYAPNKEDWACIMREHRRYKQFVALVTYMAREDNE